MTTRVKRRRVAHPRIGQPECFGDSYRAVRAAVADEAPVIDINIMPTLHFVDIGANHWPRPLRHDFVDEEGTLHPNMYFTDMDWNQVTQLISKKGEPRYRVHRAAPLLAYALDQGLDLEPDLKAFIPAWRLKKLISIVGHPRRLMFKALARRGDKVWVRLREVKKANPECPTLIVCRHPFIRVPKEYERYIDHYRHFKPRYV